jgi:hypothetical protein
VRTGRRPARAVAGLTALVVLTASGCATHDGGTSGALAGAAEEAASAAASGAMVVELAVEGSATTNLVDTVLADGLAD